MTSLDPTRAIEKINSGIYHFQKKKYVGNLKTLKYILIDEFQDFTELFYKCIKEIKTLNHNAKFFCVGDDWQAINGLLVQT